LSFIERMLGRARPLFFLLNNGISLAGAALTTASSLTLILFWVLSFARGAHAHTYGALLFIVVLPSLFLLGLVLMPIGMLRRFRDLRRRGGLPTEYPRVDLRDPLLARAGVLFGVLTVANFGILGVSSYHGLEYMDSTDFCGLRCHSVMAPEYTAYVNSPHSRVSCVECHIGAGADWFVRSKLSGTRQIFATLLQTYSRPIPSPVEHLRPARETCEQCHWPQKFHGDRVVVRKKYADDEANSETVSVLVLKVGGSDARGDQGIHGRHLNEGSRITYVSDAKRSVIPWVSYVDDEGRTVEFVSGDGAAPAGERRQMDCVDCHNRPTHAFQLPERALDDALAAGRMSPRLPWLKKTAAALLRAEYPDRETALRRIPEALVGYYRDQHPAVYAAEGEAVERAAQAVAAIYERNVFPDMKVGWGTHPNHIGHEDFPGCFRCHDDDHNSSDGRVINQDCEACHSILAMDESDPKVLADLGLK
jgi:nitrate/TMAO reductase-like tetraheme cytochrome c subunit